MSKFKVVGETPILTGAIDHLEAAVSKAKAAGATVFTLVYQVADEMPTTQSFPPALGFQVWFTGMTHDMLIEQLTPTTVVIGEE